MRIFKDGILMDGCRRIRWSEEILMRKLRDTEVLSSSMDPKSVTLAAYDFQRLNLF
jgi:hypothetical protein